MALEKESATYEARIAEMKQHEGEWVLISGDEVVGFFRDYEGAIGVGYKRFGIGVPFMVKQVPGPRAVPYMPRMVLISPVSAALQVGGRVAWPNLGRRHRSRRRPRSTEKAS